MTTVKITELTNIGANLATSTVVPVVNMAGTPTTQKTTVGNIANLILEGAGVDYPEASVALLAQTVSNAAQPNITSVGTLTTLAVSGNASVNGNLTSNGTAYVGNLSTTGIASITTLSVGATANLGAVGNVTITGGTVGQVLTTNGSNVLSWTTVTSGNSSYGNSDVANYLPTFTGNIGANVVTANLFVGSGANLTNLAGGNVVGAVPYATTANLVAGANVSGQVNYASIANSIAGINVSGQVNFAATANSVAAANVSGLGNIATINLDGNISNALLGNGAWGPVEVNVNSIYNGTSSVQIPSSNGNVSINVGSNSWSFTTDGDVHLPGNSYLLTSGEVGFLLAANEAFEITTSNSANYSWFFNPDGSLLIPEQLSGRASIFSRDSNANTTSFVTFPTASSSNLTLGTNSNRSVVINTDHSNANLKWTFDNTGNLTLPGNTFAVNYANGAQVSIGGNTGNITFSGNVISTTSTNDLLISLDNKDLIANTSNGGAMGFYSGNSSLVLNNDTPGVELTGLNVNIVAVAEGDIFLDATAANGVVQISSEANTTITANGNDWTFDNTGNLNLPTNGDLNFNAGGIVQAVDEDFHILVQDADDDGFALLLQVDDGAGNVLGSTELQRDSFSIQFAGGGAPQFRFNEDGGTQLPGNVRWDTYVDQSLFGVSDNTGNGTLELKVISYASDTLGSNVRVTQSNAYISTSNVAHTWTFGDDGRLTFPGTPRIDTDSDNFEVQAAEAINFEANAVVNIYTDAGNNAYQWQFGDDGNLIVPGNTAIYTSNATGGNAGNSITIKAGAADQSDYYTTAGGNLNLAGGLGATDDGGGGGPGGDVNIASGLSADPAGHAGNINITAGSNDWVFDYNGTLTVPGNLAYIGASPAPSINGFNSANFAGNVAGGNISTTGNISGNTNGYTIGYLNIPQVSASNTTIALSDAGKHYYSTTAGNFTLTVPNNASAAFATGTAISIVVQAAGNILVNADTGVTLYMAGNSTAANRVVGGYGMATLMKVGTDTWFINGTGVS